MKTIKNLFVLVIIAAISTFPSCSSDDGGGDPTITIDEKLAGTWSISSIRIDGSDATSDFSGFGITLSSFGPDSNQGSYTINGGYDLLDGSGSYSINGTSGLNLSTSQGNSISVSIQLGNDDKSLTFSFNNPTSTFGGGKLEGIAGDYVFELSK